MSNRDLLLKYESESITEEEFLTLFQEIYDTGMEMVAGSLCEI